MKQMRSCFVVVSALVLVAVVLTSAGCSKGPRRFRVGPVDLTKWTAVNYNYPPNGQPYAEWVVSEDKLSATQEVNADPSIFLSDRTLARTSISGTWLVEAHDDDDFIGFVFGYQNPGQFYLFDWKSGTQSDGSLGTAEQGMAVKVVDVPYTGPPSGNLEAGMPFDDEAMWSTQGAKGKVTLLHHEPTEGWEYDKPYRFRLDFRPGTFRVEVKDDERVIYDRTFEDTTYRTGRFGFYNYSQGGVVYKGFETTVLSSGYGIWWLIIILVVVVVIVLIIVILARTKRPRVEEVAKAVTEDAGE